MPSIDPALRDVLAWPIARRSIVVAVVVGTIINLINQGDRLGAPETIEWSKALVTYTVPFCVATYGAYSAWKQFAR